MSPKLLLKQLQVVMWYSMVYSIIHHSTINRLMEQICSLLNRDYHEMGVLICYHKGQLGKSAE